VTVDTALRGLLGAITARLDIIDARLGLIVRRLDDLEGEAPQAAGEVRRIPKFKLHDINARLEGDDIA